MVHGGRALHRAAFGCYGAPTRSIGAAADATGHPPVPSARPTRWYRVSARSIETAPHAQAAPALAFFFFPPPLFAFIWLQFLLS